MKLKNFDFTQKVYLHPEHVVKLKNKERPFPMTIEVDLTIIVIIDVLFAVGVKI